MSTMSTVRRCPHGTALAKGETGCWCEILQEGARRARVYATPQWRMCLRCDTRFRTPSALVRLCHNCHASPIEERRASLPAHWHPRS